MAQWNFVHTTAACLICAFFINGCSKASQQNTKTSSATTPANVTGSTTASNSNSSSLTRSGRYTLVGRFDTRNANAIAFAFANSKIGFQVAQTANITLLLSDTGFDRFKVNIDGVDNNAFIVTTPSPTAIPYAIAQNLNPNTSHTIWLTKVTEFDQTSQEPNDTQSVGTTTLLDCTLDTNGVFNPSPPAKPKIIEFIGDSSCTGYGVLHVYQSDSDSCAYSPATQDATQSVPQYTAAALGLEVYNISASGKGIYSSYYEQDPNFMLPAIYQEILPYNYNPSWKPPAAIDVVVVNAGGDDLYGNPGSGYFPDQNAFINTYVGFLTQIRSDSPNALLVCVVNPGAFDSDRTLLLQAITQVVQTRNSQGDNRVVLFDVWANTPYNSYTNAKVPLNLDYGCQEHYGPKGAMYIGTQLAAFIQNNR